MCGVVEDGIVPGVYGYEAGQSGVGDIFAWFVENARAASLLREGASRRASAFTKCWKKSRQAEAGRAWPAGAGLVERQPLDAGRCGAERPAGRRDAGHHRARDLPGAASNRRPTARARSSTRLTENGVPVNRIVAAGGLPEKNEMLMQIYADVTNREFRVVRSSAGPGAGLGHARRGRCRCRRRAAMPTSLRRPQRWAV